MKIKARKTTRGFVESVIFQGKRDSNTGQAQLGKSHANRSANSAPFQFYPTGERTIVRKTGLQINRTRLESPSLPVVFFVRSDAGIQFREKFSLISVENVSQLDRGYRFNQSAGSFNESAPLVRRVSPWQRASGSDNSIPGGGGTRLFHGDGR